MNRIYLKAQLRQIGWITVAWTLISLLDFLLRFGTIEWLELPIPYFKVEHFFLQSVAIGISAGLLGGTMLTFLWARWLRMFSYGKVLLWLIVTFIMVYFVIALPASLLFHSIAQNKVWYHTEVWDASMAYQFSIGSVSNFVFWLLVSIGTLIVLQVNDKYGPGIFRDFLLGKYFHPKKEKRIFMFLDLRGSTHIAEELGEMHYFNFLRDVFAHITNPILSYKGEIYQYVGDEVVITWKTQHARNYLFCIQCFFAIKEKLKHLATTFHHKYGVQPIFKAGIHVGNVMVGEMGVVKREIAYSGDVLNTAARIQAHCNELESDLLVSEPFALLLSQVSQVTVTPIGDIPLRGKAKPMRLYRVEKVA